MFRGNCSCWRSLYTYKNKHEHLSSACLSKSLIRFRISNLLFIGNDLYTFIIFQMILFLDGTIESERCVRIILFMYLERWRQTNCQKISSRIANLGAGTKFDVEAIHMYTRTCYLLLQLSKQDRCKTKNGLLIWKSESLLLVIIVSWADFVIRILDRMRDNDN